MEAELVPSLSPLLQGADEWREVLLLLPLLVALEAVLSADNAIALAAISRRLHDPARQRQALNLGLLMALVLRMALILAARWVLDAWPLQLAAAAYLLWLCGRHLLGLDDQAEERRQQENSALRSTSVSDAALAEETTLNGPSAAAPAVTPLGSPASSGRSGVSTPTDGATRSVHDERHHDNSHHQGSQAGPTLSSIALTLAFTDLAFSLDSVAAAVAVTDRLALVMAGGLLGVLALRLTAGLFVRWLELFSRLETAGYLAVGLVGIRLLLRLLLPDLEVPEWLLLLLVTSLFVWGFSKRVSGDDLAAADAAPTPADTQAPGPVDALPVPGSGREAETEVASAKPLPAQVAEAERRNERLGP